MKVTSWIEEISYDVCDTHTPDSIIEEARRRTRVSRSNLSQRQPPSPLSVCIHISNALKIDLNQP